MRRLALLTLLLPSLAFAKPVALTSKDGAVTAGLALRAGTPMSYLALEGGVEATKKQKRYNLRLSGRAMF